MAALKLKFKKVKNKKLEGARTVYFMKYLCEVITFFHTGLDKSAFSIWSFGKLVFRLPVFSTCSMFLFHLCKLNKIYIIFVFIGISYSVILLSLYKKKFVKKKYISHDENLIEALNSS